MSYINIHKVDLEVDERGDDRHLHVPTLTPANEVHSLRHGEELMAAAKLLARLDDLGEGEALVIWRDLF